MAGIRIYRTSWGEASRLAKTSSWASLFRGVGLLGLLVQGILDLPW